MSRAPGANADETRQRIYGAALRLFASRGFAAVGIREIARAADLTTSALYHYMGTKEDLLVEIMTSTTVPLIRSGNDVIDHYELPEERLAALVEVHVWAHGGRGTATLITDSEVRSLTEPHASEVLETRDEYEHVWRRIVEQGIADGTFDVLDAKVATIAILELCTGVAHWYRPGGRLDLKPLCRLHADLALATVRATRSGLPVRREDLELLEPEHWINLDEVGPDLTVDHARPPP